MLGAEGEAGGAPAEASCGVWAEEALEPGGSFR